MKARAAPTTARRHPFRTATSTSPAARAKGEAWTPPLTRSTAA